MVGTTFHENGDGVDPFWLAIDPWGSMRPHIHGATPTYLVSTKKAIVTSLVRRTPEPRPGLFVRPVMVPTRLKRGPEGLVAVEAEINPPDLHAFCESELTRIMKTTRLFLWSKRNPPG